MGERKVLNFKSLKNYISPWDSAELSFSDNHLNGQSEY